MKRDLARYERDYVNVPFEQTMTQVRKRMLLDFIGRHQFRKLLEAGCADKPLFTILEEFDSFVVVEPGKAFCANARALANIHPHADRIQIFNRTFEEFHGNAPVDCVILSSLLHELEDPEAMVDHAFQLVPPGCWLHVDVPNAKSFHRLWAREAGLIKTEYQKSDIQIRMQQNHTFDLDSLTALVKEAGFVIAESGSYLIKPFTHAQMQHLLDLGILTEDLITGLMKMEKYIPGLGAEIFVNAQKPSRPERPRSSQKLMIP